MRYSQNAAQENVLEPGKSIYEKIRGNWNGAFFRNESPITVELGCGSGEYTTGLAAQFPNRNFVGIDVKGDRMWRGAGLAEDQGLRNVGFLRATIDFLDKFFAPGEIAEAWIPFPDPRPKEAQDKRRLTHPRYLTMYRALMQPGGLVHFKTDDRPLFDYTLEILGKEPVTGLAYTYNLYASDLLGLQHGIQTKYEQHFIKQGVKINYLHFRFKETPDNIQETRDVRQQTPDMLRMEYD
jgi:tRNA (guanine-N7-)-methyltransferase